MLIKQNESVTARRRVYFHVIRSDGISPAIHMAGKQPQIAIDGAAWQDTGIGVLNALGHGRYYAELDQALLIAGRVIETRFQGTNADPVESSAETVGDSVQVVAFDPHDAAGLGLGLLDATVSSRAVAGDDMGLTETAIALLWNLGTNIDIAGGVWTAIATAVRDNLATELARLDTNVSSRTAPGATMALTSAERDAVAQAIEAAIINETDGQAVLQAIIDKINSSNIELDNLTPQLIATAVRDNLAAELARLDVAISTRTVAGDNMGLNTTALASVLTKAVEALATYGALTRTQAESHRDQVIAAMPDDPDNQTIADTMQAALANGNSLDVLLARTAAGIVVNNAQLADDGVTLLLRQGEAYTTDVNNPLDVAVKDHRLQPSITSDNTTVVLRIAPRNGTGGSEIEVAGTIQAFHSETSTADLRFNVTSSQTASLKVGPRANRWEIDFVLQNVTNRVLTAIIDHPCTVSPQIA